MTKIATFLFSIQPDTQSLLRAHTGSCLTVVWLCPASSAMKSLEADQRVSDGPSTRMYANARPFSGYDFPVTVYICV